MVPTLEGTIEFIHRSTNDPNKTIGVLKAAVGLLGDLGDAFGGKMFPVFSQPYVLQLISEALQEDETRDVALWAQKVTVWSLPTDTL
jgi:hypothetical protein